MSNNVEIDLIINGRQFNVELRKAGRLLRQFSSSGDRADKSIRRVDGSMRRMVKGLRDFTLIGASVRGTLLTLRDLTFGWQQRIIQANAEIEKLTVLMAGMSGKSTYAEAMEEGARQTGQLLALAQRLPFTISTIADSTAKLKAVGMDPLNGSLQSLSDAVAAFGGDDQLLHRATIAIQQMSGKGVISMEELRQQLGEAIPLAMQSMSDATGLAMDDMVKIISQGRLRADGTLQKMLDQFSLRFAGASSRMMGTWDGLMSRLSTQTDITFKAIGDAGYFDALKEQVVDFTNYLASPAVLEMATSFGVSLANGIYATRDAFDSARAWMRENQELMAKIVSTTKVLLKLWVASKFAGPLLAMAAAAKKAYGTMAALTGLVATQGVAGFGALIPAVNGAGKAFAGLGLILRGLARTILPMAVVFTAIEGALWAYKKLTGETTTEVDKNKEALDRLIESEQLYYDVTTRRGAQGRIEDLKAERAEIEARRKSLTDHFALLSREQSKVDENSAAYKSYAQAMEELSGKIAEVATEYGRASSQLERTQKIMDDLEGKRMDAQANHSVSVMKQQIGEELASVSAEYSNAMKEVKKIRDRASTVFGSFQQELLDEASRMQTEAMRRATDGIAAAYEGEIKKQVEVTETLGAEMLEAIKANDKAEQARLVEKIAGAQVTLRAMTRAYEQERENLRGIMERDGAEASIMDGMTKDPEKAIGSIVARVQERTKALTDAAAAPGSSAYIEQLSERIESLADQMLQASDGTEKATASIEQFRAESLAAVAEYAKADSESKLEKGMAKLELRLSGVNARIEGQVGLREQLEQAVKNGDFGARMADIANKKIADTNGEYAALKLKIDEVAEATDRLNAIERDRAELRSLSSQMATEALAIEQEIREASMSAREAYVAETEAMEERYRALINSLKEGTDERKRVEAEFYDWQEQRQRQAQRMILGGLQEQLQEQTKVTETLASAGATAIGGLADALSDSMLEGKSNFRELANSMLKDITRIIMRALVAKAVLQAINMVSGSGTTDASNIRLDLGLNTGQSDYGFADQLYQRPDFGAAWGGVTTDIMSGLNRWKGGVLSQPTILAAEAGMNEAFVPLPDGRSIPVTVKGGMQTGTPNVEVNVINQSGQQVDAEQGETRFDGQRMVLDVVLKAASKPGKFRDGMRAAVR